jgi:CheY-like chemotaxis protein
MSFPAAVRVFVVEDEQLVVMMIESMLEELGCTMSGTAHSVPDALSAV